MADWRKDAGDWRAAATGEPGQPGHDPYARGPSALQPKEPINPINVESAEDAAHRKELLAASLSHGQSLTGKTREQREAFEDRATAGALGEFISGARGLPFVGGSIDELSAALQSGSTSGPKYDAKLKDSRAAVSQAVAKNPALPLVGSLAFAPAQPASAVGRVGFNTAAGALEGVGAARTLNEAWGPSLVGALTGGGVSAGGEAVGALGRGAGALGDAAQTGAKKAALGSLGMSRAERAQLAALGKTDDAADELLRGALGYSQGGTAERVAAGLRKSGKDVGDIRKGVDTVSGGKSIDPEILGEVLEAEAGKYAGTPEAEAIANNLRQRAAMAKGYKGGQLIPLSEAEEVFKSRLNDAARKAKVATAEPPAAAQAREVARDATAKYNEEQAERLADLLAPDLASRYGPAKRKYATYKELSNILRKREPETFTRASGLDPLELPDVEVSASGGSEGITGNLRSAIGRALGGVTLPATAKGLNLAGDALRATGPAISAAGRGLSAAGPAASYSAIQKYLDLLKEYEK